MQDTTISYGPLEGYILDTLRNRFSQGTTIAELAEATTLPPGTVRMGLQWLLACDGVEYHEESYRVVGPR